MADTQLIEKLMLLTAPVVALSTDEQGIIQLINPAVLKVFGYYEGEMLGQNLLKLLPELEFIEYESFEETTERGELEFFLDDEEEEAAPEPPAQEEGLNYLARFVNGHVAEGKKKGEIQTKDKHGQIKWVDVAISKINVEEHTFYSVVISDITDIKKSEGVLRRVNEHLEEMVAARTAEVQRKSQDIQIMLQNLPQGILTIVGGLLVHDEYSDYLETILETDDIAGKGVMDLLFSHSTLGADTLSQMEAAIHTMLGEELMLFEFNNHLLVQEYEKSFERGATKSLELSWSAITNSQEQVEKLLISVRDVTEIRALQAEASHQKKELEIIGQILSVSSSKFADFIIGSREFIEINRELLLCATQKGDSLIDALFRNMHTVKGNARTYGFDHLTHFIHEVEQEYADLRNRPESDWDPQHLLAQLNEVERRIEEYTKVSEEKLGRTLNFDKEEESAQLSLDRRKLGQFVERTEHLSPEDAPALFSALQEIKTLIRLADTESLPTLISGLLESLPELATALGKESPRVVMEDDHLVFHKSAFSFLKNTFMHLLRNSMDHGIETPEVRQRKGKSPQGTIHIGLSMEGSDVRIDYGDDGAGLNLAKMREKATQANWLKANQPLTADLVARLVFQAGISTAERVTDVSGRGVGMDAVRSFARDAGGSIDIQFLGSDFAQGDFMPFRFILRLPARHAERKDH